MKLLFFTKRPVEVRRTNYLSQRPQHIIVKNKKKKMAEQ